MKTCHKFTKIKAKQRVSVLRHKFFVNITMRKIQTSKRKCKLLQHLGVLQGTCYKGLKFKFLVPGIVNSTLLWGLQKVCHTVYVCVRTLILHWHHHETHTDTQKKMQITAIFRGAAIIMLKASHYCFLACSDGKKGNLLSNFGSAL